MRKWVLILVIVLAAASRVLYAADRFMYDLDGTQIFFTVCDSLVVVKHSESFDTLFSSNSFTLEFSGLIDGYQPQIYGRDFYEYGVVAGYDIDVLLAELRQSNDVIFAQATYVMPWKQVSHAFDEILIRFKEATTADDRESLLSKYSLTISLAPDEFRDSYVVRMTSASPPDLFDISNAIFASGLVIYSTPNMDENVELFSNDRYFPVQHNLHHDSSFVGKYDADIDAPEAWTYAHGDTDIVIAFIDIAFDLDHEDFDQGKVLLPFDAGGQDWRLHQPDYDPRIPASASVTDVIWGHGTWVMGFATSIRDNSVGVAGIASNFYYMPIKVYDDRKQPSSLTIEESWKWAIDHNADVISYSAGGSIIPAVENQILRAHDSGIVVICAAGNNYPCNVPQTVSWPASMSQTLAVGASDHYDNLDECSKRGVNLDILAPVSSNVANWTTDLSGAYGTNPNRDSCDGFPDYSCSAKGTSHAAPQAAAVAALVISRMLPSIRDTASADLIMGILKRSADDQIHQGDVVGYDTLFGWGRLNAERALLAVVRGDANNTGEINISDIVYLGNYIYYGGPAPVPNVLCGDANGTGSVNIADLQYLIAYVFNSGPPPPISFNY